MIVVAAVREMWPALAGEHGLRQIGLLWLVPAVALAAVSMFAAALLQRRVLSAAGLDVNVTSMMAITVAGNAMSVTLPLAGSAAGTAFTYLWFQRVTHRIVELHAGRCRRGRGTDVPGGQLLVGAGSRLGHLAVMRSPREATAKIRVGRAPREMPQPLPR